MHRTRLTFGSLSASLRLGAALVAAALATPALAQGTPTYDSAETRAIVERMLEAHGGLEAWWSAPSFDYTMVMYLASLAVGEESGRRYVDNWRYYRATIEPETSRGYLTLPTEKTDGAHVGHDGTRVWRRSYTYDEQYREGPMFLLYYHYAMINLPWLTQQDGVHIARSDDATLPGKEGSFSAVDLTFDPEGKTHDGLYRLFVDPETYRLTGWVSTTALPVLPGDVLPDTMRGNAPPTIFRVVDQWSDADGLLVPQVYNSIAVSEDGSEQLAGTHLIVDPSFVAPLRPRLLAPPADAEVLSGGR